MYYSATLFATIGFNQPIAVGLIISGTNFLFTLVALKYIDIIGRRKILIYSAPGMVIGLVLASISFHCKCRYILARRDTISQTLWPDLTRKTDGDLIEGTEYPASWSAIVLVSMIIYVASYATGLGNIPWQQGELFSLEVRGIGSSLCTTTNWAANLLIGATYLSLMDRITPAGAFGFYAGLCLLGWIFCLFCFPETAGLTLEEVQLVFEQGFGFAEMKTTQKRREEQSGIANA